MRIASLVPSATEALFALGLGDDVVAVTHECDWPDEAADRPHLTRSVIPAGIPAAEIDRRVRELTARGDAIYALDEERLAELDPELIVTQALCAVCAVSYDEVCQVAAALPAGPEVISLDPENLDEVIGDLPRLADACGVPDRGTALAAELRARLAAVKAAVAGAARPRVLALEWLDPPYIGGHWVPEMVALAGGTDVLGTTGAKSRTAGWDELVASNPDVVVLVPCGLYAQEAAAEGALHADRLGSLRAARVLAVDAASSFSRPGPRLADGVELLGHLLHPDRVPAPQGIEWHALEQPV